MTKECLMMIFKCGRSIDTAAREKRFYCFLKKKLGFTFVLPCNFTSSVLLKMEETLSDILKDPSRPAFLFGSTPPREGTTVEKAKLTCAKFTARSAVLATDGFIVYDIQDEAGRTEMDRPFPFRKTMDAALYASYFKEQCTKECVVYKCVVEKSVEDFDEWVDKAVSNYGHNAFTLVGAPTSSREYKGPSLPDAGARVAARGDCDFGCVSIAERHTKKGNEDMNMFKKQTFGAEWFITQ